MKIKSPFRINNVVTKMRQGEMAYGCMLSFPSSTIIELMGLAGMDYVLFDAEHGPFTPPELDDLCRVADMAGLTSFARVPDIEPSTILRFLDRGVMGIMGPHITTPSRARRLVDACRYAPLGRRSFGSGRGAYFGDLESGPEYIAHTNSQIIVMAQLEDVEVLDSLEELLAVEGIDVYSSGAQDIAQSLGLPGQPDHPNVKEFESHVRRSVHKAGKQMAEDIMLSTKTTDLFLNSARTWLYDQRSENRQVIT